MGSSLLILLMGAQAVLIGASSNAAYPAAYGMEEESPMAVRREVYGGGRIIDISHRIRADMPTWGSGEGLGQFVWVQQSMKNGSLANNSEMKLPTHTGTHVDSAGHVYDEYLDAGFDVDTLDLDVLNGAGLLIDVPRHSNLTAEVMESLHIPRGIQRVLFRTLNTDRKLMWKKEFDTSYVGFMKDGAQWLVDNTDIKLVGIDYLSVAAYHHLIPSHLVFLQSREHLFNGLRNIYAESLRKLSLWKASNLTTSNQGYIMCTASP
ncbi:hypothetical protein Leryth_017673 [Lithospermum erythrorhizon]|nr:hypothetical protein Leryth_017673 [Lithospermum erythrorhizon]